MRRGKAQAQEASGFLFGHLMLSPCSTLNSSTSKFATVTRIMPHKPSKLVLSQCGTPTLRSILTQPRDHLSRETGRLNLDSRPYFKGNSFKDRWPTHLHRTDLNPNQIKCLRSFRGSANLLAIGILAYSSRPMLSA